MTNYACGHCGRHHGSIEEVRQCSTKNPGRAADKPPLERWLRRLPQKRRPRPELNVDKCQICRAEGGQACISKKTGKTMFITHATHKRRAIEKAREEARLNNPDFKPLALDKSYDRD